MGHRFERIDAGYILPTQYVRLQKRGHEQRPLQTLIGEIGGGWVDVPGRIVSQILADHEDQVDVRGV